MSGKIGFIKVVAQTNKTNLGTVFFFHGSGDSGEGVFEWIKSLVGDFALPHIKFIFPTAPVRPYTPFDGDLNRVWFDRLSIAQDAPEHQETLTSIGAEITQLIQNEVNSGVPLKKIIVGGFSMGGALALQTAYRFMPGLAGCFALSAFLNEGSSVYEVLKKTPSSTPLLMCHGNSDGLVHFKWGKSTFDNLTSLNIKGEFVKLDGASHELEEDELHKVLSWIVSLIPNDK